MAKNSEMRVDRWVNERLSALTAGDQCQPNLARGLVRLREQKARAGRKRNWVLVAVTAAACLFVLPAPRAVAPRLWRHFFSDSTVVVPLPGAESASSDFRESGAKAARTEIDQQGILAAGKKARFDAPLWPNLDFMHPVARIDVRGTAARDEVAFMPVELAPPSSRSFELVPTSYETYLVDEDFPKTIESADKVLMFGEEVGVGTRLLAVSARVQAFSQLPANPSPSADQLTKERDAALLGVKLLEAFPKPANQSMSDEDFAKQKKPSIAFFYSAAAAASMQLKDNAGAVEFLKAALVNKPDDAVSAYNLGLAYLGLNPPRELDGFWALARAIDMKISQSDEVRDYLKSRILAYEEPGCGDQVDAQLNELLQLAANSSERPPTYTIPSQACTGVR